MHGEIELRGADPSQGAEHRHRATEPGQPRTAQRGSFARCGGALAMHAFHSRSISLQRRRVNCDSRRNVRLPEGARFFMLRQMKLDAKRLSVWFMILSCLTAFAQEEAPKTFFLPKNPTAAAYILNRLSNKELIVAPRSEFVYVALLQRKGLERKYRVEAIEGLAEIKKTDAVTEPAQGMGDLARE